MTRSSFGEPDGGAPVTLRAFDGNRLNTETPPTVPGSANVTPCAFGSPASICVRFERQTWAFLNEPAPVGREGRSRTCRFPSGHTPSFG